jgi:hypothetical protein
LPKILGSYYDTADWKIYQVLPKPPKLRIFHAKAFRLLRRRLRDKDCNVQPGFIGDRDCSQTLGGHTKSDSNAARVSTYASQPDAQQAKFAHSKENPASFLARHVKTLSPAPFRRENLLRNRSTVFRTLYSSLLRPRTTGSPLGVGKDSPVAQCQQI